MLKVKLLLSSVMNKIFFIFLIFLISCSSIDKNPTEYSKVGIKTSCKKQIGYGFWDYFFDLIFYMIDSDDTTLYNNDAKYDNCIKNEGLREQNKKDIYNEKLEENKNG